VPERVAPDFTGRQAKADTLRRLLLLLKLPAKQRAVLVLRFYEDLTEAQVADALGVTRGTVSRYVARGLAALRVRLDEEELAR
jgi:RNA polymerase sigma factor (sigma-70 family)